MVRGWRVRVWRVREWCGVGGWVWVHSHALEPGRVVGLEEPDLAIGVEHRVEAEQLVPGVPRCWHRPRHSTRGTSVSTPGRPLFE